MAKRILFLDSPSFGKEDMMEAFESLGFEITKFYDDDIYDRVNERIDAWLDGLMTRSGLAFAFSWNYYPILSSACERHGLPYISFVYDSPQVALYSTTMLNDVNHVFIFDRIVADELKAGGIENVHYLPLCANVKRLDSIVVPESALPDVSSEVSFVGSLYNEAHNFYDRLTQIKPYTRGYLEGIMKAQMQVQGYFFLEELLTPEIISDMDSQVPVKRQPDGVETLSWIYAYYYLARKLTSMERQQYLKDISRRHSLKIFTHNRPADMPAAHWYPAIDWKASAPAVYRNSSVNLNISLRSIRTGIPLRCFEIMGSGGFLISNFQEDFLEYFTPGRDFVYYESEDDLIDKVDYYLSHDSERRRIAARGHDIVRDSHSFTQRAVAMLDTADISRGN